MHIADKIKSVREKLGLTQAQAAQRWGTSVRTLQGWENKDHTPRGLARVHLEGILDAALRGEAARPARKRSGKSRV